MGVNYHKLWNEIHTRAVNVYSERDYDNFCRWIRQVPYNELQCPKCRNHMIEYIRQNPPERAENAFFWTWKFHDAVNIRLGKRGLSYREAANMYA